MSDLFKNWMISYLAKQIERLEAKLLKLRAKLASYLEGDEHETL